MDACEFEKIWVPLNGKFYRTAFYLLESGEDAMDAVQNLYVKLWNARDSLDGVINPQAYGIVMIRNICIDMIRHSKAGITERLDGDAPAKLSSDESSDRKCIDMETVRRLGVVIADLPQKQRDVIRMKIFDDLSYGEIAKKTGLSELNLRVLVSMARKNIRTKMRTKL
ncbi:MAG: sigma-70 family RNA polymerase sigma factor [Bacteroidales bacterium]|jgi:RNA polymerase sigma-70 factor (ECF subfamily)|nr:sigma-70 family RNA polymerase sigma factor [Bacteroidales bacterium]MCI1786159.1 sigma-70 family RNA polymerase sigma factor [Bacteroidales bacterium]